MTDREVTLYPADDTSLDRIESLLESNDLPNRDIRQKRDCFAVAFTDGDLVGVGGVERHGSDGLLRSVVAREQYRGDGYGAALCRELEAIARADGVDSLYLLTTTAAEFFRRQGYEAVDRTAVPDRIRQTTEFAELCPESATCLSKHIDSVSSE